MKPTPLSLRKKLALELWRQKEKLVCEEHPLKQLFWECTLRCDLKCRHCGSDCKMKAESNDMPKEDFLRVLDSIAAKTDPHKVFVIISGGEPLMRRDIEACGRAIYEKGFLYKRLGQASAESVILLVIILVLTLVQFRLQDKWVHYS